VVRSLRGDQIARMVARHQISQSQFEAGRHYQSLHEIAFARALHSLNLAAPVIDKSHCGVEPFSEQQRAAHPASKNLNLIRSSSAATSARRARQIHRQVRALAA
jgi:hypothetical protein